MNDFEHLPPSSLVGSLSSTDRATFFSHGSIVIHPKGSTLIEQGQPAGCLHLVIDGELRVFLASQDALVNLGYPQKGECVGEMSLLERVPAGATVVANVPSTVWTITRDSFDAFLATHPRAAGEVLRRIALLLARRLRRGGDRLLAAEEEA